MTPLETYLFYCAFLAIMTAICMAGAIAFDLVCFDKQRGDDD